MTEDDARRAELVRAVEIEDREATLLTREDREQADAHARAAIGSAGGRKADARFLATRARFAATRLATRHPGLAALLEKSRWPAWLGIALPLVALAAGVIANEFGTDRRLDLLAVPLLGTVAWNLAVYVWLALLAVTGKGAAAAAPLVRLTASIGNKREDGATSLDRAAAAFRERWTRLTAPLNRARLSRTLHLGAALFAAGLIAGIYARALVIEYRAGWESTFLAPPAVHALLSAILGPASAITGVAIPPVDQIAAMRWTGDETSGVNAGPWIHLYTATVVGLVVVPRLLLAGWQAMRAWRLARAMPVAGRDDFYTRRLLRAAGSRPGRIRVTPYAYRPGEETHRRLAEALKGALGEGTAMRFDEPVDYGAEEGWTKHHPPDPEDDFHVLLFTLSSTPEAENHGRLAADIAAAAAPGTVLAALVDESPFRAHFAGQAGLDARIADRLASWRAALAAAGTTPVGLDLSQAGEAALAERIEGGLLPDAGMRR